MSLIRGRGQRLKQSKSQKPSTYETVEGFLLLDISAKCLGYSHETQSRLYNSDPGNQSTGG